MLLRALDEIIGTERDVRAENDHWVSRRFLLKDDGMGFFTHIGDIRSFAARPPSPQRAVWSGIRSLRGQRPLCCARKAARMANEPPR
ncbi:MAG TPA: ectoine synthase [Gammaproteobacteria bacterium]